MIFPELWGLQVTKTAFPPLFNTPSYTLPNNDSQSS